MSDTTTHQGVRRVTRVRTLGDAVPVVRGAFADTDDVKIVPKTSDELRADRDARRDAAPMSTRCGVDGCPFSYTGTAGECRTAAAAHRASTHPELVDTKTYRKRSTFKKRGEPVDAATVAESRQRRQERDDAQRIETINRGRRARGERPLEEAATVPVGDASAASSSSLVGVPARRQRTEYAGEASATDELLDCPPTGRSTMSTNCKIDGCDEDAADAPKAGPTSRLCATHRAARSAELSAERTGKPRGAKVVKTAVGVPPQALPAIVTVARRDPIRTADIPYDADVLESEAAFLRDRAGALDQIASGIRRLAALNEERAA